MSEAPLYWLLGARPGLPNCRTSLCAVDYGALQMFGSAEKLPAFALTDTVHPLAGSAAILCTRGPDVIRKEAWPFYRTISRVHLCWELEEPKGPEGSPSPQPRTWGGGLARASAPPPFPVLDMFGLSTTQVPVSAYVGSSQNFKALKGGAPQGHPFGGVGHSPPVSKPR